MTERRIEYRLLDEITPADRNPKGHDLDVIRASIARFGFIEALVLDERTGKLVSGHGRTDDLLAAQDAGLAPPDGITIRDDGRWLVPVQLGWASRDDEEALAAGIALNRAGERGGWKRDELWDSLTDLARGQRGLDGVGFTQSDLSDLATVAGGAPDLDELARNLGEPGERDFWPVLHLTVSPETRDRWRAYAAGRTDEDRLLGMLLDAAVDAFSE